MKLTKLGANCTQVHVSSGLLVLYSYDTPVAIKDLKNNIDYKTSKKWSATTSRHINKWCSPDAISLDQRHIEMIIEQGESALPNNL